MKNVRHLDVLFTKHIMLLFLTGPPHIIWPRLIGIYRSAAFYASESLRIPADDLKAKKSLGLHLHGNIRIGDSHKLLLSSAAPYCLQSIFKSINLHLSPPRSIPLPFFENMLIKFPKAILAASLASHAQAALLGSSFGVPGQGVTYDYVIVGGGQAGLTVAARLVEQNAGTVGIIEAGSFYEISNGNLSQVPATDGLFTGKSLNDSQPLIDWNYATTPQTVRNEAREYAVKERQNGLLIFTSGGV